MHEPSHCDYALNKINADSHDCSKLLLGRLPCVSNGPIPLAIAGNFRGAIFLWISWFEACVRRFYPRIPEQSQFMKQCADSYYENIATKSLIC